MVVFQLVINLLIFYFIVEFLRSAFWMDAAGPKPNSQPLIRPRILRLRTLKAVMTFGTFGIWKEWALVPMPGRRAAAILAIEPFRRPSVLQPLLVATVVLGAFGGFVWRPGWQMAIAATVGLAMLAELRPGFMLLRSLRALTNVGTIAIFAITRLYIPHDGHGLYTGEAGVAIDRMTSGDSLTMPRGEIVMLTGAFAIFGCLALAAIPLRFYPTPWIALALVPLAFAWLQSRAFSERDLGEAIRHHRAWQRETERVWDLAWPIVTNLEYHSPSAEHTQYPS